LLAPVFVLVVHLTEGQFLTPMLLGRRLELNAAFVFLSIAFWSLLWGLVGAVMAVPMLVVLKVVCDNIAGLQPIATSCR
jgi:predicted PurR-regulated permease PerM